MCVQVQAAIKKKMEKRRRKSIEQGGVAADGQSAAPLPQHRQKSRLPTRPVTAEEAEDSEALEEKLEEMMEGRQRRNVEAESEEEPVDLLPIVHSVFGQVGQVISVYHHTKHTCVCVCVLTA